MKKILILIKNYDTPPHVTNFAIQLAKKENLKIKGLFIGGLKRGDDANSFPGDINLTDVNHISGPDVKSEERLEDACIKLFMDVCEAENLNYHVHRIKQDFLDSIIDETAFADIVLCNDDMNVSSFSMQSFISSAHCPVVLIPSGASFFNTVIFTYDDNISSVYAIRQFTYLFPWCSDFKVFLVSVLPENILQMVYDSLIREWILLHYPKAEIIILKGDAKKEISLFVNSYEGSIMVMGAFGRSSLSRFFKESIAPSIVESTNTPLFISHA